MLPTPRSPHRLWAFSGRKTASIAAWVSSRMFVDERRRSRIEIELPSFLLDRHARKQIVHPLFDRSALLTIRRAPRGISVLRAPDPEAEARKDQQDPSPSLRPLDRSSVSPFDKVQADVQFHACPPRLDSHHRNHPKGLWASVATFPRLYLLLADATRCILKVSRPERRSTPFYGPAAQSDFDILRNEATGAS